MKYTLSQVYRAMAMDELYHLIDDEFDLTVEDVRACEEARRDLGTGDISFTECTKLRDNLNFKAAQDTLAERISVLQHKLIILRELRRSLINGGNTLYICSNPDPGATETFIDGDAPF